MFGRKKKTKDQEMEDALAELRALPRPAMDFTTPEGAILCLEDAMRRRDLEGAVACKDFEVGAVFLLMETMPELVNCEDVQQEAAKTLELGYRAELSGSWPNMEGVESFFVDQRPGFEDMAAVVVTELSLMPDGTLGRTDMLVACRNGKWRVIHPVSEDYDGSKEAGNFVRVDPEDPAMKAAVAEAKATAGDFVRAFHAKKPGTTDFCVRTAYPTPSGRKEHLWIEVLTERRGVLNGIVTNEPEEELEVKDGQKVTLNLSDISDWKYNKGNKLVGGYTIRYFVKKMPPKERKAFLKKLPFEL